MKVHKMESGFGTVKWRIINGVGDFEVEKKKVICSSKKRKMVESIVSF